MQWTDEQLGAIETTDKGVIVSAAAGSGKTAVLVERIIRLLSDEEKSIPADTLVAVTFTNDAAAQMREKISLALEKRIAQEPDNEWLLSQQLKLPFAKITTINAFCYDIVKSNSDKFDIQSGVKIIDDNDLALLKQEALDNAFEIMCRDYPEEFAFAYECTCSKSDLNLRTAVLDLSEFKRSVPFPETWVEKCRKMYLSDAVAVKTAEHLSESEKILFDECADILKRMLAAIETISEDDEVCEDKALKSIEEIYSDDLNKLDNYKEVSGKYKTFQMKSYLKTLDKYEAELEFIRSCHDEFKKAFSSLAEMNTAVNTQQISSDNTLSEKLFTALNSLSEIFDSELWQLKLERNAIEYSDNEIMAVRLLAKETKDGFEPSDYALELQKQGVHRLILLDEYQDVNNLQDIIFKCLSIDGNNDVVGRNEFVVGDIKQSIYRFRLTNPQIMMRARKNASLPENAENLKEILLSRNFRSRQNVVDFTNFCFKLLMSEGCGEIEYNDKEKLVFSALYNDRAETTEIILADDLEYDKKDRIPGEYLACASRIREMLDKKALVFENGVERECIPSDFCILTRKNSSQKYAAKALEACGLTTAIESENAYLKSREVSLLINMLKIIDLPTNDIAMASVLMSEIFMLSEDDMAQLRLLNMSGSMNFYMIMLNVAYPSERSSEDFSEISDAAFGERIRNIVDIIRQLRVYASYMTIDKLITKIFDLTDYFSVASTFENASQKRANLRLLQSYAYSYENSVGGGLSGFIRYINSIYDNKNDLPQAVVIKENENAVSVKTIHKSKGLEYPFVFICDLSSNFNTDNQAQMLIDENLGVAFKIRDIKTRTKLTTEHFKLVRRKNTEEAKSESMRLLYVALTRAKEKLFICFSNDKNYQRDLKAATAVAQSLNESGSFDSRKVSACGNMRQWLMAALMRHKDCSELMCGNMLEPVTSCAKIECLYKANKFEETPMEKECAELYCNEDKLAKLKEVIGREYNNKYSLMTSKLTVTEIAKDNSEEHAFYPQLPAFSDEISKMSAAEKGTAAHDFMQYCDFAKAEENINGEVKRLVLAKKLSNAQGECINTDSVKSFFESDLYNRLKSALSVEREKQFFAKIGDLPIENDIVSMYNNTDGMLQGVADCIFEESDGYVIIDYKTDKVTAADALVERYTLQLKLYAAAFNLLLDKPVKQAFIYSFVLKEIISVEI